jgi:hypothetical protein
VGLSFLSESPAVQHPSFWSQVPGWVIPAIATALVGLVLSRNSIRAAWWRVWRSPPVDIHIETDAALIFANYPMDSVSFAQFVPLPVERLPEPPPGRAVEMGNWAKRLGGMPALKSRVEVTITAREDCHVVVERLRVNAVPARLPDGCVVAKGVGGGEMEFRRIDIGLATTGSAVRFTKPGGQATSPFEFELHPGESAKFSLSPMADGTEDVDLYEWDCLLDLLCRGKAHSVKVDDKGERFRLVNRGKRPQYICAAGGKQWNPW